MYTATGIVVITILAVTVIVQGVAINKEVPEVPDSRVVNKVPVNPNNGFAVQTGYETYVTPSTPQMQTSSIWLLSPSELKKIKLAFNLMTKPVSSFLAAYGMKALNLAVHVGIALLLGIAITAAFCNFTPYCSMYAPGLSFLEAKSMKEKAGQLVRKYMSPEKIEMVSNLVQNGIDTYFPGREAEPTANPVENETK